MFQINWKLKVLLYKILGLFRVKGLFYLIQRYITKRSKIEIYKINKLWIYHTNAIEKNQVKSILEIGLANVWNKTFILPINLTV